MSDKDIIYWSLEYKLKLSDFQKKEIDKRQCFSYVGYNLKIIPDFNQDKTKYFIVDIDIKTFFSRKKSWFDPKILEIFPKKDLDWVILHEQGHFDLQEESLPIIKKKLLSTTKGRFFPTHGSNFEEIKENAEIELASSYLEQIKKTMEKIHKKYDLETNHSLIRKKQMIYNRRFEQFRKMKSCKH